MKKIIAIILSTIFLYGCADSTKITPDASYSTVIIPKKSDIYVSLPGNGSYGDIIYTNSGHQVATIIKAALLKHTIKVEVAATPEDYDAALTSARQNKADYVFYSSILHWEDRATEWSARPDRITVKITVISAVSGQPVSSVTIDGKSGLATFGGDHPQDLLPKPVGHFVDSLFSKN